MRIIGLPNNERWQNRRPGFERNRHRTVRRMSGTTHKINKHAVYARVDVTNIASWRVMEKTGMTLEGTLRSHGVNRGVRHDYLSYGILRHEWKRQIALV